MTNKTDTINPFVVIVVLNFNGADDTIECVRSLGSLEYANYEIIIVDNGSAAHSVEKIANQFPETEMLKLEQNLGYTGGNNQGIKWALDHGADYVYILNNDTVVDAKSLSPLIHFMESNSQFGITSPKILYYADPDLICFYAGVSLPETANQVMIGKGEVDSIKYSQIRECTILSGCALLVRAEVFGRVGLFNEDFFCFAEEYEFNARAMASGYKLAVNPSSVILHKESRTAGRESAFTYYYSFRNRILLLNRLKEILGISPKYFAFSFDLLRRILYIAIKGHNLRNTISAIQGIFDSKFGVRGRGRY